MVRIGRKSHFGITGMNKFTFILFFVFSLVANIDMHAQSENCLPLRFFGGQEVLVTGSIDAGGLPYRGRASLEASVGGFIPVGTAVVTDNMSICVEGRNWYEVLWAESEEEDPRRVWVMDGDGYTYWLEPIPLYQTSQSRMKLFPNLSADYLFVDSYDEQNEILRFSAVLYPEDQSVERRRRYFDFDISTGFITEVDYWYRDNITHEFTDKLGITEQVFGDGEDFSTVFVSPDKTKVLYRIAKPAEPDCIHFCITDTLWMVNSDGSDPIALYDFYGSITRIIWNEGDLILVSLASPEVYGAYGTLIICADGSCALSSNELILGSRELPFDYITNLPSISPNGEWAAAIFGGEELVDLLKGDFSNGFVLSQNENKYIQLPYNGNVEAEITWLDNDTILYPVMGLSRDGWDATNYNLPSRFYDQDALWEIDLDFENLTYRIKDRLTNWDLVPGDWTTEMFYGQLIHHIIPMHDLALIYSEMSMTFYRLSRG